MSSIHDAGERAPLLRVTSTPSLPVPEIDGHDDEAHVSTLQGAFITAFVGLLIFLQATNISILTTTQSSIAADLDAFEKASWFTSAYLIAMSSLAPLMGRLCQVFSPRLCMFFSTLFISIGSIITSTSMTFEHFIVGRVVTGAGGGGIFIVASIMAIQMTSAKRRGLFMGLANAAMTIGVSLGAVIAGALEPRIGWKPLFGIQAPVSLFAGIGLLISIPASHTSKNKDYDSLALGEKLAGIDYAGALLLTTTIVLFLLSLSGAQVLPTPLLLSAFMLPIFLLNEIYVARDPVIPVSVLRSRGTLLTCLATSGFMMARWAILFYTPVYALAVRGWAPAVAGSILIPTNAGFAAGGILAGVFHIKRTGSFYLHTIVAMAIFPFTMAALSFISTPWSPWWLYVAMVFLNGLVTGATTNYALVHLLHLTLPEVHPVVISLLTTFRGFAGPFGSAIGGGFFVRVLRKSLTNGFAREGLRHREDLMRRLLGSPALVNQLEGVEKIIAVEGYQDALKALFLGAVGLSIIVTFLQSGTGWKEATKEQPGSQQDVNSEETPVSVSGA
ncbi:hypothetical protein IAQ61_001177 [Plenodomus lingam]|uniref:Similar to MFS multidrug transporter n=1 Tax=Leptosphaeria maculans (strain JN3 / isolate v23.1.3 / race Av1-4-5-6-7-8) TaxID=985895 RepID=E5A1P3_LEPMJ|nr:similar to MFS multidrug transporter [Plenodomus lingam JN3]KAH9880883.1 hypothetical protein IAQ61_001177 [Plenodomus lingam]CBX97610.1 similar to MFS multidrug transporter [Plenodomus lingam JN3]